VAGKGDPGYGSTHSYGVPDSFFRNWSFLIYNVVAKDLHRKIIMSDHKPGGFNTEAYNHENPPLYKGQGTYLKRLDTFFL
jgi:hypothetical protein